MQPDFEAWLHDIHEDQWGTKGPGLKAAALFRQAAADKRDLSEVLLELIVAFDESNQIPMMRPLAEAVTLHYLHRQDPDGFWEVLRKRQYGSYFLEALGKVARSGVDIAAFLPLVVGAFGAEVGSSAFELSGILGAHLARHPTDLERIISLFLNNRASRPRLVRWLNEYCSASVETSRATSPFLLALLPGLEAHERQALAATLAKLFLQRSPTSEEEATLVGLMSDPSGPVRTELAFILAGHYGSSGRWESVDDLLAQNDPEVRLGAVRGLGFPKPDRPTENLARFKRTLGALVDPAPVVRGRAHQQLMAKPWQTLNPLPDADSLARLLPGLENPNLSGPIQGYFSACLAASPDYARALLSTLQGLPEASRALARKLEAACEERVSSQHAPSCAICEFMPRVGTYSSEIDVPQEARKLQDLRYGALKRCPACGNLYQYHYSEEWESPSDGMSQIIEIGYRRLHLEQALAVLKGAELRAYRAGFDSTLAAFKAGLDHPKTWMREEAAWALTLHHVAAGKLGEVAGLLGHPDAWVKRRVLATLLPFMEEGLEVSGLETALEEGLSDPDGIVRGSSADALCRLYLRSHTNDRLHGLLARNDPFIKRQVLMRLFRHEQTGADVSEFRPAVAACIAHPDEEVRRYTRWLLVESDHADVASAVSRWSALLEHVDPVLVLEAIQALGTLAGKGGDIRHALPFLIDALADQDRSWHALSALRAAFAKGADISGALPRLAHRLEGPNTGSRDSIFGLLGGMLKRGLDLGSVLPTLGRLVLSPDQRASDPAITLINDISVAGHDITPTIPFLAQYAPRDDSYGEYAVYVLTRHRLAQGDWADIRAQLAHKKALIRAATGRILEQAATRGTDISPVVPSLVQALMTTRSSHCYSLAAALKAYAGQDASRVSAVMGLVPAEAPEASRAKVVAAVGGSP